VKRRRERAGDAPLFAWGESLPIEKTRRSRVDWHLGIAGAAVGILLLSAAFPPAPRLVWNGSASAPIGLYAVTPGAWVEQPGDLVIARLPERYRQLAAERRYLPLDVPLVKRVVAFGGDKVCALGNQIFVNGRRAAVRQANDPKGRPMPKWNGCIRLHGREVFLLMDNPASFDGRYFGATKGADIIGKARMLWRR
jgi:conjugative transfer signal peptidase TraF